MAIEVEKVLNDLYPLLRAVQPAAINKTLNAIATALEGRGEMIGENFETVDSYLRRLNPQIPAIVDDLRLTAKVSTTYAQVMPQIAAILRNTIKTTGTLEDREKHCTRSSPTCRGSPTTPGCSWTRTATTSSGSASSERPSCGCSRSTRRSTPA